MITHTINKHFPKPVVPRIIQINGINKDHFPKYTGTDFGSTNHRKYIHQRAMHYNTFSKGDYVIYRRKRYYINDILEDYESVCWIGMSPKFIEMIDNHGTFLYANPGDIKKARY